MSKPQLRQQFCTLREDLSAEDVSAASAALCHRLVAWLERHYQPTSRVLTYLAFRNEPDLGLLFELLPDVRWVVPRITKGRRLVIHPYDATRLVRHQFGMLEPAPDQPEIDPVSIDVVFVPGVAFDRRGGRLGFGGGYYDRFLLTTPASRVGMSFDDCLIDELPCSDHDQRMDWIITPTQEFHVPSIFVQPEHR